jgi:hypothetical protein
MYRKAGRPAGVAPTTTRTVEVESLAGAFEGFGEVASEFVRKVSPIGDFSRRDDADSVKDNLTLAKKVFSKWSIEIIMSTYSLHSVGFGT